MCGIAGFLSKNNGRANNELRFMVNKMADTLQHRGPDDSGVWVDAEVCVALGHRRLSILDLSPEGNQPCIQRVDGMWLPLMVKFTTIGRFVKN